MANKFDGDMFNEHVIENKETILVDFYTPTCGPCKALAPTLDKLSAEYNIAKVDASENGDLASKYRISAVPTLILFKDGKEIQRALGLKTEEQIRKMFEGVD